MEPTVLWGRFVEEFATQLSNTCSGPAAERLRIAWTSGAARTQFYGGYLLPRVAASLGLKISYEAGKIDWTFSSEHPAKEVVAIESENVGGGIVSEEIPALCRSRAPLKVLITCQKWTQPPVECRRLLPKWEQGVARELGEDRSVVFGLIVGEMDPWDGSSGELKFHWHTLWPGAAKRNDEPTRSVFYRLHLPEPTGCPPGSVSS